MHQGPQAAGAVAHQPAAVMSAAAAAASQGSSGGAGAWLTDGVMTLTIDGVCVPCVTRNGRPHGPVRVLEKQLMNGLLTSPAVRSSAFHTPPSLVVSTYLTELEALRLTYMTGSRFTRNDLVVDVDDFRQLHTRLKTVLYQSTRPPVTGGGWLQLNNRCVRTLAASRPSFCLSVPCQPCM